MANRERGAIVRPLPEVGRELLRKVYEGTIRRHLPRSLGVYNGVVTRKYYLLDLTAATSEPEYKRLLVDAVRDAVTPGDTVVEIGAGFGVCTTWAARCVGETGRVVAYEANREQVAVIREALELTGQATGERLVDRVDVRHALVGANVLSYGPTTGADTVPLSDLPTADVLLMDCEGAELDILGDLATRPERVVVETHPQLGASTRDVVERLSDHGYDSTATTVTTTASGTKDVVTAERT